MTMAASLHVPREKHYMYVMSRQHVPLLSSYNDKDDFDGQPISDCISWRTDWCPRAALSS